MEADRNLADEMRLTATRLTATSTILRGNIVAIVEMIESAGKIADVLEAFAERQLNLADQLEATE